TTAIAADVEKAAVSTVPAGLSTSRVSSISSGNITSGEDRNQPMLEAVARTTQQHANQLAARLKAYGHERQALTIDPGKTRVYVFVFEAQSRKKPPFEISVATPAEPVIFTFKE